MSLRAGARSIAMAGGGEDHRALGVEGRPAGDGPVAIPGEAGARSTMKFTSRWFLADTPALLVCAPTCAIYRTLAGYLAPSPAIHAEYARHRAAADRIIAAALPPGWAVRRGLYLTFINDAGIRKAYAYVSPAVAGRPFLTVGFHAESGPPPAPAVWDLSDPESPGRFRAWLAGMTRARRKTEGAK